MVLWERKKKRLHKDWVSGAVRSFPWPLCQALSPGLSPFSGIKRRRCPSWHKGWSMSFVHPHQIVHVNCDRGPINICLVDIIKTKQTLASLFIPSTLSKDRTPIAIIRTSSGIWGKDALFLGKEYIFIIQLLTASLSWRERQYGVGTGAFGSI